MRHGCCQKYIAAWLHKVLEVPEGCTSHSALGAHPLLMLSERVASQALGGVAVLYGLAGMGLHHSPYLTDRRAQACGLLEYELTYSKFMWHLDLGQQVASQPLGGVAVA